MRPCAVLAVIAVLFLPALGLAQSPSSSRVTDGPGEDRRAPLRHRCSFRMSLPECAGALAEEEPAYQSAKSRYKIGIGISFLSLPVAAVAIPLGRVLDWASSHGDSVGGGTIGGIMIGTLPLAIGAALIASGVSQMRSIRKAKLEQLVPHVGLSVGPAQAALSGKWRF